MNVDEIKHFVDVLANKWKSGAISSDEYNLFLASANIEYFKLKVGLPEEYQVGQYNARQAWQVTQKITDDMRFLIKKIDITKNSFNRFPLPADYGAFSSLSYTYIESQDCGKKPVIEETMIEVVTDGEKNFRKSNSIIPPTLQHPIAAFYWDGLEVLPDTIHQVSLTYLRIPQTPFRAYTIVDDESVYDPSNSVQLEYPETTHYDIAYLILKMMGLNIRKEEVIAFATQRQMRGQ